MKILIDMNLSPLFVNYFSERGIKARHWSDIGAPETSDSEILNYAKNKGYIILTHDLDFGAILAATKSDAPSVLQIRTQNILPAEVIELLINALADFEKELEKGALISIDKNKARAKILPIE